MQKRTDNVVALLGMRRRGKTTLLIGGDPLPFGIVDIVDDDIYIIDSVGNLNVGMRFNGAEHLRQFKIAEMKGVAENPTGIYTVAMQTEDTPEEFFRLMAPSNAKQTAIPGLIVVDEAYQYCTAHSVNPHFNRIMRIGGNYGQSVLMVSHYYKQLNKKLRNQVDCIISFEQKARGDVRDLQSDYPGSPAVSTLNNHDFMIIGETRAVPWTLQLAQLNTCVYHPELTEENHAR
jgi:hypothetical protein